MSRDDEAPYKIKVVVDRRVGEQLSALENGVPVWMVDTPLNRAVAVRLWNEDPHRDITTFIDAETMSPEDVLVATLDTIDLRSWQLFRVCRV